MKADALLEKIRVVVIDDDPSILDYIKLMLKGKCREVITYEDPITCLKNMTCDDSTLILCDIEMPSMNGLELYTKLKSKFGKIPALFITGHLDYEYFSRLVESGAITVVEKPFTKEKLLFNVMVGARYVLQRSISEKSYKTLLHHFDELKNLYTANENIMKIDDLESKIKDYYQIRDYI